MIAVTRDSKWFTMSWCTMTKEWVASSGPGQNSVVVQCFRGRGVLPGSAGPVKHLHEHHTQTMNLPSVFALMQHSRNYKETSCTVFGAYREASKDTIQEVSAAWHLVEHQTHRGSCLVWTLQLLGRTGPGSSCLGEHWVSEWVSECCAVGTQSVILAMSGTGCHHSHTGYGLDQQHHNL